MHRMILLFLALLLTGAAPLLHSQEGLAELERAWQEDRFDDLEKLLPAAEKAYPRNPTVAFLRALVLADADEAFASYKRVFESEEMSRYADTALFKMAQYQYARERFTAARRYFQMMQKRFPQTRWLDDSLYLTGQCYLAEGKSDSARLVWNSLIKRFPRSPYCDMAVADLESSVWDQPASAPRQSAAPVSGGKPFYSIQVGAFSKQENAHTILAGLEKVGYEGMIVEKKVGTRLFYAVWIGSFPDRESAEDYARRFIVKVTKEYSIVKSE
ncbi:MAG TPA: SPOR domain-containing protein [bacterium]|nr:SPOR domain-containing protein [bacterium]HOC24260.1 SPOR domain-containing protein [bacterium]HOH07937.1 SPOR domain-containing protein [bacterium]HPM60625.1 SPOR domain-containing protein [bacterium]